MGANEEESLRNLFLTTRFRKNIIYPKHTSQLPSDSNPHWIIVMASQDSLSLLARHGSRVAGMDGVWKIVR